MNDYADLEAQMVEEAAATARTDQARARLTGNGSHLHEAWNPEALANARRTLQLHGTPALHDWLLDLENQVIDLLRPEDQDYFKRRQ